MKVKNSARLWVLRLIAAGIVGAAIVLCAAPVVAQPSPKPVREIKPKQVDQTPVGQPKKIETADGYTLVYTNKDGEICRQEKYNSLGAKLESKNITAIYPSGQSAGEKIETFGEKNGKFGVKLSTEDKQLDSKGKTTRSDTIYVDDNGDPERRTIKENGQTKEYVPDRDTVTDYGTAWKEVFQDTNLKPPDIPAPKKEEPKSENSLIDPCVIGEWETAAVSGAVTGGHGFRLKIKSDGTQIVDYSSMQILTLKDLTYRYGGTAEGLLETQNGIAKNISIRQAGVTLAMGDINGEQPARSIQTMGPGALGVNKNNNSYTCSAQNLKYATEDFRGNVFLQITMKRSKADVTP